MKAQHFLLVAVPAVDAYISQAPLHGAFVGRTLDSTVSGPATIVMDIEGDPIDRLSRFNIEQKLNLQTSIPVSVSQAEGEHGMPWRSSIDPKLEGDDLLYMPFWDWQMGFMKESLSNLRVMPCEDSSGKTNFSYKENSKKKARIVNLCMASDEYRKIRMTYYDAGESTQVFNAVWYPNPAYNLPVLGIDLLAFNGKKYLAIVDFQPLYDNEEEHATAFEHKLKPIKEKYESLKGRMSSKFYDETQFFSQQMLFARFEDGKIVSEDLLPAFQQYVETHVKMVHETEPDATTAGMQKVLERQQAYDTYSAERDPATGLFAAMFGGEWANGFVHDFLFSLSEPSEGGAPKMPPMGMTGGGGPPPQQQGQQARTPSAVAPVSA